MRVRLLSIPLLSLCLLCAAATRAAAPEDPPSAWIAAPGFEVVDVDDIESAGYYDDARFPGQAGSAFHPDAGLAAPVRALLLVEYLEGLLPHARYRVSWHVAPDPAAPGGSLEHVEVQRFNLGPARREDLVASVPEGQLADAGSFGVGPDVAWRFAMAPRRGMRAGLEGAARRELSAEQSAAVDCLGVPCAGLQVPAGPAGEWRARGVSAPSPGYAAASAHGPHPARVAEDLVAAFGEEAEVPLPLQGAPRFVFVISSNVDGQDLATLALARDGIVLDDDTGAVWVRWLQLSGAAAESALLFQPRR